MSTEQGGLSSDPDQAIAGLSEGIDRARRLARDTNEALREIQMNMTTRVGMDVDDLIASQAGPR